MVFEKIAHLIGLRLLKAGAKLVRYGEKFPEQEKEDLQNGTRLSKITVYYDDGFASPDYPMTITV